MNRRAEGINVIPQRRPRLTRDSGLGFLVPAVALFATIFVVPIGYIVGMSFHGDGGLTLDGYRWVVTSSLFSRVLWTSIQIAATATAISTIMGYTLAVYLSRLGPQGRAIGQALVLLPFWTSILVKSYSFTVILGREGLINTMLTGVLGYNPQIPMIFNRVGVLIGMSNHLIPFIVFPVLANLLAQDKSLLTAAAVMGSSEARAFWRITFPLSLPALAAGALMSSIISFGFFVTPAILGGRMDVMLANLIDLFTRETLNWTYSSAIALVLLVVSGALALCLSRFSPKAP